MSGSGSSGGDGGLGPGLQDIDCTRISATTVLNSPVPNVINSLNKDDILDVKVQNGMSLVAVTQQGDIAGALTPTALPRIVECIGDGFEYVAIVLSVSGGECCVHIKLRSNV